MAKNKTKLPACGLFLGSGIYEHSGRLVCSGKAFTYWSPDYPTARQTVDLIVRDNQGNTAQFWQNGQTLLEMAQSAISQGLYVTFLYSNAEAGVSAQFKSLGDHYLGYDFGERYSFGIYDQDLPLGKTLDEITLKDMADGLMRKVAAHVDERHKAGWGHVMATSSNFYIDYEIAAGAEVPVPEDFAFRHLLMASAISRGLYRQYDLPLWGSHLAHEWYSWLPQKNPLKFPLFKASLYLKYLSGAKLIINESGNWALQSSLCPDSPMHTMPRVIGDPPGIHHTGQEFVDLHIEEARKLFCNIDYRSPTAAKYRKEISGFYDFVKANPAPAGQPEATVAVAKGNYDICGGEFAPNNAIAGAFRLAQRNPDWYEGDPERGWDIVKSVFYPRPPVLAPNKNFHVSGSPYGMVDIVSFANDQIDAAFLKANYKALIFSGWNTCSAKQYAVLVDYVKAGGRLCLAIPHLSTNVSRNYHQYGVEDLVNGGDFSELCGLKVTGQGDRFYWATGPELTPNAMGLAIPRRYGIIGCALGRIEIADPSRIEVLAADDEESRPFILRCKSGKGEVFFINSWAYPGALNTDDGPGCTVDSKGLMGLLYGYIARISRGHVWITGQDFTNLDADSEYIAYSYFPDAGKICLQNIDFKNPRRCILHQFGDVDPIELAPAEFRILNTVTLKPGEKINQE
ncbi:MAG: hypothetical protein WCL16_03220 [bacterium]